MPGGDKTGPAGQGPMTGRGAGPCGSGQGRGSLGGRGGGFGGGRGGGSGRGRGYGGGRGRGRGFGFGWTGSDEELPPQDEAEELRKQVEMLERRLAQLEKKD